MSAARQMPLFDVAAPAVQAIAPPVPTTTSPVAEGWSARAMEVVEVSRPRIDGAFTAYVATPDGAPEGGLR